MIVLFMIKKHLLRFLVNAHCRYRDAGAEVITVLARHCSMVERASVDEAYLDITAEVCARLGQGPVPDAALMPNTHVAGLVSAEKLEGETKQGD